MFDWKGQVVMEAVITLAKKWFSTWRFPSFVLFLLVFFDAAMAALVFVPMENTPLAAFAEEFKIWCFGYDPGTRSLEWGYVWTLILELLALSAIIIAVWQRPLSRAIRTPRILLPSAVLALTVVAGAGAAFGWMRPTRVNDSELPFPADRLRTSLPPPALSLTDHTGQAVTLEMFRGRVVMLTGVYARCGNTCPMIMREAREAARELTAEERDGLTILAVTLNPEHDDTEVLSQMAAGHGVSPPLFHLLTGEPARVNQTLDDLSIARTRDPQTGVIDHANVFVLIDRNGRVAYRLAPGARQRRWLVAGLRALLHESGSIAQLR
jgi:protein SCO1